MKAWSTWRRPGFGGYGSSFRHPAASRIAAATGSFSLAESHRAAWESLIEVPQA
jgi:hypothetical protein